MDKSEEIYILIVDDRAENLLPLEAILEGPHVSVIKAMSGNEALSMMLDYDFAIVLLDVQMPGMDGFETAELMRGNTRTKHVPIIFITAINKDISHVFKGYESGGVDYIFKPFNPDILKNKVNVFVDLYKQKKIIEKNNHELKVANKKIIEHQSVVVQEERLKVLLQMAGATAHELNQPLMALLGYLELIISSENDYQKIVELVPIIKKIAEKVVVAIKRIHHIRHDSIVQHNSVASIMKLDIKNKHDNLINTIIKDKHIKILSVEDSDSGYEQFASCFKAEDNVEIFRANTVEDAIVMLKETQFDIVFSEYQLHNGTVMDLFKKINLSEIEIPLVVITDKGDEQIASSIMKAGAYDYLSKASINKNCIFRIINTTLEKFGLNKEINKAIKKMADMTTRDQLTGLYNRRYMKDVFKREMERSNRYKTDLSCIILDLDFFKLVNDNHGHVCGDYVLQEFARRLQKAKRQSDYLFRYGGEEFLVLLPQTNINAALLVAEKFCEECRKETYDFEKLQLNITVSVGVASIKEHNPKDANELIVFADKALYTSKETGRNRVSVYKKSPH